MPIVRAAVPHRSPDPKRQAGLRCSRAQYRGGRRRDQRGATSCRSAGGAFRGLRIRSGTPAAREKKGRERARPFEVDAAPRGVAAASSGDLPDQTAFLAALTVLFNVSVTVSLTESNEVLASEPIASEVFSETPRTSWLFA